MGLPNEENLGQELSTEHRTSGGDHKPQAIVYDPSLDEFNIVECEKLDGE